MGRVGYPDCGSSCYQADSCISTDTIDSKLRLGNLLLLLVVDTNDTCSANLSYCTHLTRLISFVTCLDLFIISVKWLRFFLLSSKENY